MIRITRLGVVHGAFVCFALALVGRSAWVQLGETEYWRSRARVQHVSTTEVPAARGALLDANGRVLVESRRVLRLSVAPQEVRDAAALRAALRRVGVPVHAVDRAVDRSRKWVELPGRYPQAEVAQVLALRGVHARDVMERVPPPTDGLRRLLGTVDDDGNAVGGLEAALDSLLRGVPGRRAVLRDGRGRGLAVPDVGRRDPTGGSTVVLTIHQGLQDIAERSLADAVARLGASGGDIVVLDPHSGAIRAMVSQRRGAGSGAAAMSEPYEPGSTLKPFIAAALLAHGRARLEDSVPTFNGSWTVGTRTIRDVHRARAMSFADVIRHSSNIGIVQFAARLSPREQYEALRDAGFGMATGVPYPGESPGRLYPVARWSNTSAASLAMGYEISVTPVQLAAAYAAFANGGVLLEPRLVEEVRAADGRVLWRGGRREVRRVMRASIADTMRVLLRDVVAGGTATSADLATFEVAGKSGTARRTAVDGRGYASGAYTASFVGMFPADAPQFVILVKLDNPAGAFYGGRTAAPVTKAVLEAAIAARDAALDRERLAEAPKRRARVEAARSDRAAPRAEPPAPAPSAFVVELSEAPGADARRLVTERAVPDVRGLPTRRAVRELHRAGFRVQLVQGEAVSLQPAAGTILETGATVRLAVHR